MSSSEQKPQSPIIKEPASSNRRIAKNTVMLYIRMFLTMIIGLYTSRVVLNTLGVEDYGIYAVVGGPVAIFGFLNVSMASSTQRYLNFELGKGNNSRLRLVFMTATYVHAIISFVIVLLGETVGLWLLLHKMTIPMDRMSAAFWVYQISLIGTVVAILCTPYNATIIAHEKMSVFAYISILEVSLKLLIVFLIQLAPYDKLIFYALLLLLVQLLVLSIYALYCKKKFNEAKYCPVWDKLLIKEMSLFAVWNLWGNMAAAFYSQGLNLLLNIFFGPKINAARSIALTVVGQSTQFAGGFQTAVNPQITKLFAQNRMDEMRTLLYRSCKFSCFLLLILAVPVFIEAPMILKVWLKNVPDYSVAFLRISLFIILVNTMAQPLMTAAAATGKIRVYQFVVGGLLMLIVPVAYIVLKLGGDPVSVYLVQLTICCIAFMARLVILKSLIGLPIKNYLKEVVFISFLTLLVAFVFPISVKYIINTGFWQSAFIVVLSVLSVCCSCYFIGINKDERIFVNQRVKVVIHKFY